MAPTPVSGSEIRDAATTNHASISRTRAPSRGFLALPTELVFIILSNFPEIRTVHVLMNTPYIGYWKDADNYYERFDALRALSQLCRLAREIFLPLLWERFQACLNPSPEGKWYYNIAKVLERKSNGMLQSQHLWPHVKVITVTLARVRSSKILPLLVRLLSCLPNVHTLEIPHACGTMSAALREAFRGNIFPSIQKIILPAGTHEILRCCPEIREVTCNEGDDTRLVGALVYNGAKKLEVLRKIYGVPSTMKHLRMIELNYREGNPIGRSVEDDIKLAKNTLRACAKYKPTKEEKSRRETAGDNIPEPKLANPDSGVGIVRLRKSIALPQVWGDRYKSPGEYVPFEIEEIPVTLEDSG
ncbi:hypothetical protein FRC11_013513 [Ceratobasidium sp. 423]|nr:hypothetical protein FRC11_013513 [Ceratobasidium sp. 423]